MTREEFETIRDQAYNDCARELAAEGFECSYAKWDRLGADAQAWVTTRLGLTVRETDDCIVAEPAA